MANDFVWMNEISFYSDYYSRGISQTKEQTTPQFQSIIFNKRHGLYGGMFISRVEFNDNDQADQELDFFGGIQKNLGKWSYRTGFIYYTYPNADNQLKYDFLEFDVALGYKFNPLYLEASIKYSPNYFFDTGKETYSKIEASIPLYNNLKIISHIAYRNIQNEEKFGVPNNIDWSIGTVYSYDQNIDITTKVVGSDFRKSECANICNTRIITGLTYRF